MAPNMTSKTESHLLALIKVSGGGGSIKSKCNKSSMPMDFNINLHNDGGPFENPWPIRKVAPINSHFSRGFM